MYKRQGTEFPIRWLNALLALLQENGPAIDDAERRERTQPHSHHRAIVLAPFVSDRVHNPNITQFQAATADVKAFPRKQTPRGSKFRRIDAPDTPAQTGHIIGGRNLQQRPFPTHAGWT